MKRVAAMKRGFSLLEVILALAILCGTLAVLGEMAGRGMRDAEIARDLTQAQLLCETKLAEITCGALPAEPVERAQFDTIDGLDVRGIPWLYSIRTEPSEEEGMLVVRVTVEQDLPERQRPVVYSIDRWILDEGFELSNQSVDEAGGSTDESGGTDS